MMVWMMKPHEVCRKRRPQMPAPVQEHCERGRGPSRGQRIWTRSVSISVDQRHGPKQHDEAKRMHGAPGALRTECCRCITLPSSHPPPKQTPPPHPPLMGLPSTHLDRAPIPSSSSCHTRTVPSRPALTNEPFPEGPGMCCRERTPARGGCSLDKEGGRCEEWRAWGRAGENRHALLGCLKWKSTAHR